MHAWSVASLALITVVACGAPPPAQTEPTKTVAKPTTTAATPTPKLDPPPTPTLSPDCDAAQFPAAAALAALQSARDIPSLRTAYQGTALQQLIQTSDTATGRKDDATIAAALADPTAAIAGTTAIQAALSQWMRHNLKIAAEDPDRTRRPPAWQAARCTWQRGLQPLARELQRRDPTPESGTTTIADDIDAQFAADPLDDTSVMPARQVIEKTWYRVVHRLIASEALAARTNNDAVAARRALGLFAALRDRLQDRNTPGIDHIEAQLTGDPASIDAADIVRTIDIALVKRARKYCSEAVDPKLHTTPPGAASVAEGATYTRILLPTMRTSLAAKKFDATAHMATWQSFAEAVASGDDRDEIKRLSDELVLWNCEYQQALGIRECTSTVDEIAAAPTDATKK